jgi:Sulfotransferase domain
MSLGRYLIIGGTTKAGTTSLHAYLNHHPQVCASSIKETRFFLDRDYPLQAKYRSEDGLEHYEEYFARPEPAALRVEATPDYLYSPGTPGRLAAALPRAAVVFSLREPVGRLVSWFRFARQTNRLPAGQSFDEYVTQQLDGALPANPPQQLRALEQGCYAGYVRRFRDALGAERVLVTYYEDLASEPREVMRAICRFAEVDQTVYADYRFTVKNSTMDLRSPLVHRWYMRLRRYVIKYTHNRPLIRRPLRALRRAVDPLYLRMSVRREPPPRCSPVTADRLADYYANVADDLRTLLGAPPPWRAPATVLEQLAAGAPLDHER